MYIRYGYIAASAAAFDIVKTSASEQCDPGTVL